MYTYMYECISIYMYERDVMVKSKPFENYHHFNIYWTPICYKCYFSCTH